MAKVHAEELAKNQKQIGVAEFFAKNRHLLGFDNKIKALMTTIKEAVDNALDACEEAGILPEIIVEVTDLGNDRFKVAVEDNGPGIVKAQVANIFARLLYGSKFHKIGQSLTHEQPLLIKKGVKVALTTIGSFVDSYCAKDGEINILEEGFEVPAFNPITNTYAFMPVSKAIKHKQKHDIYDIALESGRSIRVTDSHSVFTLDKNIDVQYIEAHKLKEGDSIIIPKKLPEPELITSINIMDYISLETARNKQWYVYGFTSEEIQSIFSKAKVIHKKTSKSRKFYHINGVDVLDDSYKQYVNKGFLPVHLALQIKAKIPETAYIQSYFHGKPTKIPIEWVISKSLMRFLGFFVAEGHVDKRQVGFTFHIEEKEYVKEICDFAIAHGFNYTLENRQEKNSMRVKLFGNILPDILEDWCGKGAKNKKIPSIVFTANEDCRQHFLDALYEGDGHKVPERNQLMHSTVSKQLANEVLYLWLMQGIVAKQHTQMKGNLGKKPSKTYITSIYGSDINKTHTYHAKENTKDNTHSFIPASYLDGAKTAISNHKNIFSSLGLAYSNEQYAKYTKVLDMLQTPQSMDSVSSICNKHNLNYLTQKGIINISSGTIQLTLQGQEMLKKIAKIQKFLYSDLALQKIKTISKVNIKNAWVYDISVPDMENFVAGHGGVAAQNTRGQQGIGISACVMYGQLTTGKPAKVISKTGKTAQANYMEIKLDTKTNAPDIHHEKTIDWPKDHGTRIEIDIEATYQRGLRSIDEYLKQTAITNPHTTIIYMNPRGEQIIFPRVSEELPPPADEIKPHPYGVELGFLIEMLDRTENKTLQSFLTNEFSRVSAAVAKEICKNSALLPNMKPKDMTRESVEKLTNGIKLTKIMAPSSDCLSPITAEMLEKGLRKEINAEFYASTSRQPSVYRGNPFIIEAALAYGGDQPGDELCRIMRFANRVPLLYQQGACAGTKAIVQTNWKNYNLQQSRGNIPAGACTIAIHIASVWVPFTSESKEAIAQYDEILEEMKKALQEIGRQLGSYIGKKKRVGAELKKRSYIQKYIPYVAEALQELLGDDVSKDKIEEDLKDILEHQRGKVAEVGFDKDKNTDYDADFANIGKDVQEDTTDKQGEDL